MATGNRVDDTQNIGVSDQEPEEQNQFPIRDWTVHQALYEIQTKLSVPKTRENKFLKCFFRNAEDIVKAVVLLLPTNITLSLSDDVIQLGDRFYIKSTAILSDGINKIEASGFAREADNKQGNDVAQVTGSASSYARKYALNGLFAIDDGIDNDVVSAGGHYHRDNKQVKPEPTVKQESSPESQEAEKKERAAKDRAQEIIKAYKACKTFPELMNVQTQYHGLLKALSERYKDLFNEVNTVSLQIIAGFDK